MQISQRVTPAGSASSQRAVASLQDLCSQRLARGAIEQTRADEPAFALLPALPVHLQA